MFFTISFSHIVDGQRVPLLDEDGREVTKMIESPSKSAAMMDTSIQQFCTDSGNDTRVRRVI